MTETRRQERIAEGFMRENILRKNILRKPQFIAWTEPRNKTYSASVRRPGNFSANQKPTTTAKQAEAFQSIDRPQYRANRIRAEFIAITKRFGGEPRKIRRQLARDIASGRKRVK